MKRPKPIQIEDAFKTHQHDQDKIISPAETVRRFKAKLIQSKLRILDDVVRIDNGRLDIPVYFSLCGPDAQTVIGNTKQMGKGATPDQAQASAVMELGERFSLFHFYQNQENFHYAPLREIKDKSLDFEQIARSVNDTSDELSIVKELFSDLPLQWTWGYDLTKGRQVMIPFNWFWTINQFNGASAGNCAAEAICQGVCEVVERHVCACICKKELKMPHIDETTIKDPVALELIQKYKKAGVEFRISDLSFDMGIPSVGVIAWDPATFPQKSEIVWTAGTMPSPAKALCRALTEVAQLAGDFNSGSNYEASGLPKFSQLDEAGYVINPGSSVEMAALPDLNHNNIKTEVEMLINALSNRQMNTFVVDVRHPNLDIPAFYTIIPGAQFRERADHSSVGMICAKIIAETFPVPLAMHQLKQFNDKMPNKHYISFYLGQILINQGQPGQALAHLEKAAGLAPGNEDLSSIQTYMGICHKEMGQYAQALTLLQKADAIDSQRTDTLNLMGFCHFKQKSYEAAIACFKRIIALNPKSAIDYANIGVNYRAMGDTTKAIEYYQKALTIDNSIEFAIEHLNQLKGS